MNTITTIIEIVELGALIALVIYLIRLTRDNSELRNKLNKSELVDRNLEELNEFNGAMVADPDIARIWQDGCQDYRLNDIDRSRFSLMASQFLAMMANQKQRADSIEDWAQAEAATNRLIETLMVNPGLLETWDSISGKIASPELRSAVSQAMSALETEESNEPEVATIAERVEVAEAESETIVETATSTTAEQPSVDADEQVTAVEEAAESREAAVNQEQTAVEAEPAADPDSDKVEISPATASAREIDTSSKKESDASVAVVDDGDSEPGIIKAT